MIAEDDKLTVEFVQTWLLKVEQRVNSPNADITETHGSLLITQASICGSRSIPTFTYCNKHGYLGAACWTKYPQLKPKQEEFILKSESNVINEAEGH